MTVYRELIERQLAVRQAGLQIGLQNLPKLRAVSKFHLIARPN